MEEQKGLTKLAAEYNLYGKGNTVNNKTNNVHIRKIEEGREVNIKRHSLVFHHPNILFVEPRQTKSQLHYRSECDSWGSKIDNKAATMTRLQLAQNNHRNIKSECYKRTSKLSLHKLYSRTHCNESAHTPISETLNIVTAFKKSKHFKPTSITTNPLKLFKESTYEAFKQLHSPLADNETLYSQVKAKRTKQFETWMQRMSSDKFAVRIDIELTLQQICNKYMSNN